MRINPPPGGLVRGADVDLSDLTASKRTGSPAWLEDGTLEIPLDPEPSEAEQAKIRRRLLTRDSAHENRVAAMQTALKGIAADPSPLAAAVRLLLTSLLGPLA